MPVDACRFGKHRTKVMMTGKERNRIWSEINASKPAFSLPPFSPPNLSWNSPLHPLVSSCNLIACHQKMAWSLTPICTVNLQAVSMSRYYQIDTPNEGLWFKPLLPCLTLSVWLPATVTNELCQLTTHGEPYVNLKPIWLCSFILNPVGLNVILVVSAGITFKEVPQDISFPKAKLTAGRQPGSWTGLAAAYLCPHQ